IVNTASISAAGVSDPVASNNTAIAASFNGSAPVADLTITKTVASTYTPGNFLTYTITVGNNGPANATGVKLSDAWTTTDFTVIGLNWTCSASGTGATCPANGNNTTGALTTGTFNVPVGTSVTFTVTGTVATGTTTIISDTASATSTVTRDPSGASATAT